MEKWGSGRMEEANAGGGAAVARHGPQRKKRGKVDNGRDGLGSRGGRHGRSAGAGAAPADVSGAGGKRGAGACRCGS